MEHLFEGVSEGVLRFHPDPDCDARLGERLGLVHVARVDPPQGPIPLVEGEDVAIGGPVEGGGHLIAVTDYFGFVDSKGTYYADLSASVPIGKTGLTALAHIGVVKLAGDFAPGVSNDSLFGYTDWKVGINYALPKDFTVGVFYADTNAVAASYTFLGTNWADKQAGVFIQKTF